MKKKVSTPDNGGFMSARRMILNKNSNFVVREAYKTLRTNIRFFPGGSRCRKICITSGAAGEGKSITLLNLAISIAETGQRVLLIDADLRRPAQSRLLVEKATPGLSNVLGGLVEPTEAIRKGLFENLDVLFSGDVPPNPAELLSSVQLESLISKMSQEYDYILIDTPPVTVVADTCLVANVVDGVLLLVRQGRSNKDMVKQAVTNLQLTGARLLGFIINGVPTNKSKSYSYYD